jgi:hypothetical protein
MSLPDYVERRAEILAEFLLRDLNPKFLAQATFQGAVWDYMAAFQSKQGKLINITVEVKGTENPIRDEFIFPAPPQQVNQFVNSNLPVLILVVDVKTNSFAWNWASRAKVVKDPHVRGHALIRLPLIKGRREAFHQLRAEIEAM